MSDCRSCGRTLEHGQVTHAQEFDGKIFILENVPAQVCRQCGDGLFRPEVVKRIEELVWSGATPDRIAQVPVYDLSGLPPVEAVEPGLSYRREKEA